MDNRRKFVLDKIADKPVGRDQAQVPITVHVLGIGTAQAISEESVSQSMSYEWKDEDGQLAESLDVEYYELKLSYTPRITRVSSGREALEALDDDAIDANLADVVPSKRLRSLAARRDEILAQKAASDRR